MANEKRKATGALLRRKRELLGIPLEDVAKQAKITPSTLHKVETGLFAWDIDLHLKLCDILQIAKVNK